MCNAFFALAAVAFGAVSSVVAQGIPQLVTPLPFAEIGLNQFVEYQRPGRIVTDVSHMELTLSNSTWSGALTPAPTFSPGNGPQYIAQGNVTIDPAVWAEGAYNFSASEVNPFKGLFATIIVPVTLKYDA
ncbi:hypothetical protein GSI_08961 [Ganoderma sinense ZZ0214-1]|uniref:Uncharacterized protein n=1 Tax=Ganoderma sinense ZZ0214-1 TaxID=1077348 RepID=A0A2G8S589_9APHY|nr:hypothetical protein GSI_08961 [Ganoderma sinense ZZ0214-1]